MIDGPNWAGEHYEMMCINLDDWNDRANSLQVYRTNGMPAVGNWVSVTATESITFEYNVGFSTSSTSET